jgi:hypothetical protein
VFTPASGTWYTDIISKTKPVRVVMYDYNLKALDYWKINSPVIDNVEYVFVHIDLLNENIDLHKYFDNDKSKVFNLSNIFAYEGTVLHYPLRYRLYRENQWINNINETFPSSSYITFSSRSCTGFINCPLSGMLLDTVDISKLNKPSYHMNGDWL